MKIVVINLKKSKKRLEKIITNLTDLDISFQRFDAVYGKTMSKEEIEKNTTFIGRNFLCNYGMIGCALSHITIWKEFKKSREKFILICEDDVEYKKNFPKFLENIDKIYNDLQFDFLTLNNSIGIYNSFSKTKKINNYEFSKPIFPLTMASYILSRKGVYKLLNLIPKITYHIDFEIAFKKIFNDLEYYSLKNPSVLNIPYTTDSNIISENNGFFNYFLELLNLKKLNWLLSNTAITLFLKRSISVYCCILIFIIIFSILKKKYLLLVFVLIEFFLINF
jgi:glycosyl transferase family 25